MKYGDTGSQFLFYFNIKGSNHKKDVKLIAFCEMFQYLNNDTQKWEIIPHTKLPQTIEFFGCDYWVCKFVDFL